MSYTELRRDYLKINRERLQAEETLRTPSPLKAFTDYKIARQDKDSEQAKQLKAWKDAQDEAKAVQTNAELTLTFLKDNIAYALFIENIKAVYDEFRKYQGKPYGEKTKGKISDALYEQCGIRANISNRHDFISISKSDEYNTITVYHKNGNHDFLPDNKINMPDDITDLVMNVPEPVNDIAERIEKLNRAKAKTLKLKEELEAALDEYNDLTSTTMQRYTIHDVHRLY